jgi:hypothetical protein
MRPEHLSAGPGAELDNEVAIAEVLGGPGKLHICTAPTGTGKTYEMAVRVVEDVREGAVPIAAMPSKRGIDQLTDEIQTASGGETADDLGIVVYRRDGASPSEADDADDQEESRKQKGTHLCEAAGVIFSFPGYSHRRGDSLEWFGFVRQLAQMKTRPLSDWSEEMRPCVEAFLAREIRVYIDECDAYMTSLLRILQLDRRMLSVKKRGWSRRTAITVNKCPGFTGQGSCLQCELHTEALRGRIDAFSQYAILTSTYPTDPLPERFDKIDSRRALSAMTTPLPTFELPLGGFTWTPLKQTVTEPTIPPPEAYTHKLEPHDVHNPEKILEDLIRYAFRPTIVRHMPHTGDQILSAQTCREIEMAEISERARERAEEAFADVEADDYFIGDEPPRSEAQEARHRALLDMARDLKYPSYGCEARYLQLADLGPIGWMAHFADRVRLVGASMPAWGLEMLARGFGLDEVLLTDIPSRERLLDGVLVLDVHWDLKPAQLEQIAAHVIDSGERPLLFFGFDDRAEAFVQTHQQLSLAYFGHGSTSNGLVAPGLTELPKQRGIASYVRSAIGSSANLPQYRVNIIDSTTHSPTFTLLLPAEITDEAVDEARKLAREELMRQPGGRNLRLDPECEEPQRRVIIFHNPETDPESGEPIPPPPAVLSSISSRVKAGGFKIRDVTHSVPYICTLIDEWLREGTATAEEPKKARNKKSPAQRRRETAADREAREAEKRIERREAVLARLQALREAGAVWRDARRSKGVNTPIMTWFSAEERTLLRKLYQDGAALAL